LLNIICTGGLLAQVLSTPLKYTVEWEFYATTLGDCALLWTDHTEKIIVGDSKPGVMFEAHVTGYDTGERLWDICHKKNWVIHERKFNRFNLLLVSDVDAIDKNGSWVKIKLFEDSFISRFRNHKYNGTNILRINLNL